MLPAGKIFAILEAAQQRTRTGRDVVVAYLESIKLLHGNQL